MQRQLATSEPKHDDLWANSGHCPCPATMQKNDLIRSLLLEILPTGSSSPLSFDARYNELFFTAIEARRAKRPPIRKRNSDACSGFGDVCDWNGCCGGLRASADLFTGLSGLPACLWTGELYRVRLYIDPAVPGHGAGAIGAMRTQSVFCFGRAGPAPAPSIDPSWQIPTR